MNPTTVLHVLDLLAAARVPVWLDGGWGVDALLGRITRSHNDLDLVLPLDDLARAVEVLVGSGFAITEEELGRVVLEDAKQGRIDLHPVRLDAHGNAVQVQPAESPLVYPSEGFVSGRILDRAVACISADVQVFTRLGYDRSEKHRQDALVLCSAFGLPVPLYWDEAFTSRMGRPRKSRCKRDLHAWYTWAEQRLLRARRRSYVKRLKFTYWQDGEFYIGFLNDYPDYATQGMTKEELINNLKDLLKDIESGEIPYIRKVEELVVAA